MNRKCLNAELYKLQRQGLVEKIQETPPIWALADRGTVSVTNDDAGPSQSSSHRGKPGRRPFSSRTQRNVTSKDRSSRQGSGFRKKTGGSMINPETVNKVLQVLRTHSGPMKTMDIARTVGMKTSSEVNPTLYYLCKQKLVTKDNVTPPTWSHNNAAGNADSVMPEIEQENADEQREPVLAFHPHSVGSSEGWNPRSIEMVDSSNDTFVESIFSGETSQDSVTENPTQMLGHSRLMEGSMYSSAASDAESRYLSLADRGHHGHSVLGGQLTSGESEAFSQPEDIPRMGLIKTEIMDIESQHIASSTHQNKSGLIKTEIMDIESQHQSKSGYLPENRMETNAELNTQNTFSTADLENTVSIFKSEKDVDQQQSDSVLTVDVKSSDTDSLSVAENVLKILASMPACTAAKFILKSKSGLSNECLETILKEWEKKEYVVLMGTAGKLTISGEEFIRSKANMSGKSILTGSNFENLPKKERPKFSGPPPSPFELVNNNTGVYKSQNNQEPRPASHGNARTELHSQSSFPQPRPASHGNMHTELHSQSSFPQPRPASQGNAHTELHSQSSFPRPLLSLPVQAPNISAVQPPNISAVQPPNNSTVQPRMPSRINRLLQLAHTGFATNPDQFNPSSMSTVGGNVSMSTVGGNVSERSRPLSISDGSTWTQNPNSSPNVANIHNLTGGQGLVAFQNFSMNTEKKTPFAGNEQPSKAMVIPGGTVQNSTIESQSGTSSQDIRQKARPSYNSQLAAFGIKALPCGSARSKTFTSITPSDFKPPPSPLDLVRQQLRGTEISPPNPRPPQSCSPFGQVQQCSTPPFTESPGQTSLPPPQTLQNRSMTPPGGLSSCLELNTESFSALNKNPVSALMEYAQSRHQVARIEVVSQRGPSHRPVFVMAAFVGKRQFPPFTCSNKKDGRKEAADIALRTLIAEGQYNSPETPSPAISKSLVPSANMTHFDKVAALCHQVFNNLVAKIAENFAGRKVIAGLVMKCSEADVGSVISIGTGNRCITGPQLSLEGNTVNDSHAEIITRRGFLRFLYHELENYCPEKPHDLFEPTSDGKLRIRPGITFHLYISTAPCGDGALFSPRDVTSNSTTATLPSREHNPTFTSNVQGLLRTKMEGGEGTIPVEAGFTVQTWDGIQRGERLRTMSCTDKISRWNVVGMQGALLSHFLEPIYLDSLTLGFLFDQGHLARAVCCRMNRGESDIDDMLPPDYRLNHPWLGRVTACDPPRETQKTKSLSINWCVGDERAEVTDGTRGVCYTRSYTICIRTG